MTYISSKKKGFWLACNHVGCAASSFFLSRKDARQRGWRSVAGNPEKHLCPDCVKFIQASQI